MKKVVVMMSALAMVAGMAMAQEAKIVVQEKTEAKTEIKAEEKPVAKLVAVPEEKPEMKLVVVIGVVSVAKDEVGQPKEVKITTAEKKEVTIVIDEIGKKVAALDGKTVKVEGTTDDKGVMTVVKFEEKKEKKDVAKPVEVKKDAVKETKKTE